MNSKPTVLVTGATGYIGSHTVCDLLSQNYPVVLLDNTANSTEKVIPQIAKIASKSAEDLPFYNVDIRDLAKLEEVFQDCKSKNRTIEAVIHFAALKAAGESVKYPLDYYETNLVGTLNILKAMQKFECRQIIFSSSACVYGNGNQLCSEGDSTATLNPYGSTKLFAEKMIEEFCVSRPGTRAISLRYFNVVGAHPSGEIGEDPQGIPTNLLPVIQEVVTGKREKLKIFGGDYGTRDGTAVRDYIHVMDISKGHVLALESLGKSEEVYRVYNLGRGSGVSVKEMVTAYAQAVGREFPYEVVGRRPGDAETVVANVEKARKELGFQAEFGLKQICESSVNWITKYPQGHNL